LDADDAPGASDPSHRFGERDLVREVLLQLPARSRALLVLREVYGYSGAEAATALGLSEEAARVALWRAREHFRAAYQRKAGTP
jgi:DNA-directed RNA polymerase specialized sigma24 family protein